MEFNLLKTEQIFPQYNGQYIIEFYKIKLKLY